MPETYDWIRNLDYPSLLRLTGSLALRVANLEQQQLLLIADNRDLCRRLQRLEHPAVPAPASSATATTGEVVQELGGGWRIERRSAPAADRRLAPEKAS